MSDQEPKNRAHESRQLLLEQLLTQRLEPSKSGGRQQSVPNGFTVRLSQAQARVWFVERLYPDRPLYSQCDIATIDRWVPEAELKGAILRLMDRHDALRLRIVEIDNEPFQARCDDVAPPLSWRDLRDLALDAARLEAEELALAAARKPFKLDEAPLFRVCAVLMPSGETQLTCAFDHIIMDGWSMGLFYSELDALLTGSTLPLAPATGFLQHLLAQKSNPRNKTHERQLAYWQRQLQGELPVLNLPMAKRRRSALSCAGGLVECNLPLELVARCQKLAAAERTTLFVVLLAVFKVLLMRLTGQSDVIVGVPFAAREDASTETMWGSFVNMLPLRTELPRRADFFEIIRRVRTTALDSYENQFVPFDQIVAKTVAVREISSNPIFQVQFAFHNLPSSGLQSLQVSDRELDLGTAKFDLTLSVTETETGASGWLEYSSDLFDHDAVQRIGDMFVRLADRASATPHLPVRRLPLLSARKRAHILTGLNRPTPPTIRDVTMVGPFEKQAAERADAVALISESGETTYGQLDSRAEQVAHAVRACTEWPSVCVAVCMERSADMVIAVYAVAKTGAAYLPLDPQLPEARLGFMLRDAGVTIVLTHGPAAGAVPDGPWRVIDIAHVDAPAADGSSGSSARSSFTRDDGGRPGGLAYVMYTSGSTGRPKGVAFPVDAALASLAWMQKQHPVAPGDTHLLKTPFAFDVSTLELFWPLCHGGRLVICPPNAHHDPEYLADVIDAHDVTTANFVPSMLRVFLERLAPGQCSSLRWLLASGEALRPSLRDACFDHLDATLVNIYGPTETHAVTHSVIPRGDRSDAVPLGRPISDFRIYVLNEELEPVPIGVRGEIYIGAGVGLAWGYYGRLGLTAELFMPDPFGPRGSRMYRTGDLGSYRTDGVLDYHGRIGTQVKLRGLRIELAEISTVLEEHSAIETCAPIVADDPLGQRLIALVVPATGRQVSAEELTDHCRRFLPRSMVPTGFAIADSVPTTPNGKLDRREIARLWRKHDPVVAQASVQPESEVERRLMNVFEQILGHGGFGVTTSFFDLGGHSLLVFKLIATCERMLGARLSVGDVFAAPTVRGLAARLETPDSCLVPLALSSSAPIVVLIHPASGSILPFIDLVRQLSKNYSVYGLQARGVDDDGDQLTSVESCAEHYVEVIDTIRDTRPISLVGWSFGGNVAVEMTRRLSQPFERIATTILLDSWVRESETAPISVRQETEQAVLGLDFLVLDGLGDADELLRKRLKRVLMTNLRAFLQYQPEPFDGVVHLLRAVSTFPPSARPAPSSYETDDRGWSRFLPGLVVEEVAGNHFDLLLGDHATTLADTIERIIEDSLQGSVV